MTGPACAGGCVPFYPGPMPGAGPARSVRRANAGQCRPVPGDRLDERTAGRLVRHMCVICVSCLCHICVIYEQKFNFSAGRPPDRQKSKKGPRWIFMLYNIKIKKTRLHARAPHARLTRARTRPPARITRARVK